VSFPLDRLLVIIVVSPPEVKEILPFPAFRSLVTWVMVLLVLLFIAVVVNPCFLLVVLVSKMSLADKIFI